MRTIKFSSNYYTDRDENATSQYFKDVRRLSKDAEKKPLEERTPEELIFSHLKFAVSVAKRYTHLGVPFSDLIQYANMALIYSAKRYKPDQGCKFTSYCVNIIRWFLLDIINRNNYGIKTNQKVCDELNVIRDFQNKQSQKDGYLYTIDDIRVLRPELFSSATDRFLKYDCSLMDDPNEEISDNNDFDIDEEIDKQTLRSRIEKILVFLTPRQKYIIEQIYFKNRFMEDIADELNCTIENVRILKEKALKTLRQHKHKLI